VTDYYRDCWIYDGQVRTVERTTETGMHVRGWGDGHLVWRGHEDDMAYINGRMLPARRVQGNFPILFDAGGLVHVQLQGATDHLHQFTREGVWAGTVDAPYASEGCHHIEPDGRIVMGNDPSLRRTINGETWFNCVETANYIVGQFGRDPDYGGALSKLDKRTGQVTRWLGYTPHPPRAVELDGVLTVAISGRDTPAPDQVEWSADFPPLPGQPPVVTPPPAPADCTAERERIAKLQEELAIETSESVSSRRDMEMFKRLHAVAVAERDARLAPEQVIKLVNDATGKMAGYWRYLGVQGAVDRAVKAELAKR
jgi:hypothetical protein